MTLWHTFCCFSIVRVSDNHWTYASVHTLKSFNAELLTCTVYMSVYIHVRNVHVSTHMRHKFTVCDQYTVDSIRLSEVVCRGWILASAFKCSINLEYSTCESFWLQCIEKLAERCNVRTYTTFTLLYQFV